MNDKLRYTDDELMSRLKFTVGLCLAITLMGIVFVVLYSIIFVTQPLNAISPVDSKFFELIIPIATFLTGTLSGIMLAGNNKDAQMKALEAATAKPTITPSAPTSDFQRSPSVGSFGNSFRSEPSLGNFSPTPSNNFSAMNNLDNGGTFTTSNGKVGPKQEPHPEI